MKKICTKCEEAKDISEFHKDKTKKLGVGFVCKICKKEYQKRSNSKKSNKLIEELLCQK